MRDIYDIVKLVSDFLNKNDITYMFVGEASAIYYGHSRSTADIDLILMLGDKIDKFVEFLNKNNFETDIEDIESALSENSHFTVLDKDNFSGLRLDCKGVYTEFDKSSFNRKKKFKFDDIDVYISSPEDTILCKLDFGSEKDLNDIKGIISQCKELDMNYIRSRSKEMKTYPKLVKLLNEIKQRKLK